MRLGKDALLNVGSVAPGGVPIQFWPTTVSLRLFGPQGHRASGDASTGSGSNSIPHPSLGDAVMADPLVRSGGAARLRLGYWGIDRLATATIGPQIAARSAGCLIVILLRVWECGGGRHQDPIVSG